MKYNRGYIHTARFFPCEDSIQNILQYKYINIVGNNGKSHFYFSTHKIKIFLDYFYSFDIIVIVAIEGTLKDLKK